MTAYADDMRASSAPRALGGMLTAIKHCFRARCQRAAPVSEGCGTVSGIVTAEAPDLVREICDYASTKLNFIAWVEEERRASGGRTLGPVFDNHRRCVGALLSLTFDDKRKRILVTARIDDPETWRKIAGGDYAGFSQGGFYARRWVDPRDGAGHSRYTARPREVSVVDIPNLQMARFTSVKADRR